MEDIYAGQRRNGTSLFTDNSSGVRMTQRSAVSSSSQPVKLGGRLYDDFGSDFGPKYLNHVRNDNSNSVKVNAASRSGQKGDTRSGLSPKGKGKGVSPPGRTNSRDDSFDYDQEFGNDELDVISDASPVLPKPGPSEWDGRLESCAALHKRRSEIIKSMPKFKKNRPTADPSISANPAKRPPEISTNGQSLKPPASGIYQDTPLIPKGHRPPSESGATSPHRFPAVLMKPFKPPSFTNAKPSYATSSSSVFPSSAFSKPTVPSRFDNKSRADADSLPLQEWSANEATRAKLHHPRSRPHPTLHTPSVISVPDSDDCGTNEETPKPRPVTRSRAQATNPRVNPNASRVQAQDKPAPPMEKPIRPQPRALFNKKVPESPVVEIDTPVRTKPIRKPLEVRPFPMDDLGGSDDNSSMSKAKSKAAPKAPSKHKAPSKSLQLKDFPPLSPLSSDKSNKKAKKVSSRRVVDSSTESESSAEDTPQLREFPMNTQLLESIGQSPGGKRGSEGSDLDETPGGSRKRRKRSDSLWLLDASPEVGEEDVVNDSDLRFLDPDVDPSTLCPWCDDPLPLVPSPLLVSLISATRKKSSADPRPTNPLGLWAAVAIYADVCARHRFEHVTVPRAAQRGWPTSIQWDILGERIREMEAHLRALINDVDEDFILGAGRPKTSPDEQAQTDREVDREDEGLQDVRPRKGSIFWQDAVKNVRRQGANKASGVRGQFSSFEKTRPGYYGELGYVIISQTIYDLFPPVSFESGSTLPLTPADFIQLVLIPEAALALIMEDMSQSRQDAVKTLRESAEYGVLMFPDDHSNSNIGENIVRERARNRRKELEEDAEMSESAHSVKSTSTTGTTRTKGKRRGKPPKITKSVAASGSESDAWEPRSQPKTRKRKTRVTNASQPTEADVVMVSDSAASNAAPPQARPRPTRRPPKPKTPPPAPNFAVPREAVVDLCSDSEASVRQSLTDSGEIENLLIGSDTDNEPVLEPPSSSQTFHEMAWNQDGGYQAPRLATGHEIDLNATPRKIAGGRAIAAPTIAVLDGGQRDLLASLGAARGGSGNTLYIERNVSRTTGKDWIGNMKDTHSDDEVP